MCFEPIAVEDCTVAEDYNSAEDYAVVEGCTVELISGFAVQYAAMQSYAESLAAATAESVDPAMLKARASILDSSCTDSDYLVHSECSRGNYTAVAVLDLVARDSVAHGTRCVLDTRATAPMSCSDLHSTMSLSTASALFVAAGNVGGNSPGSYHQRDRWVRMRSRLHVRCCVSYRVTRSDVVLGGERRMPGMALFSDCFLFASWD
jgi:hypothetical protein